MDGRRGRVQSYQNSELDGCWGNRRIKAKTELMIPVCPFKNVIATRGLLVQLIYADKLLVDIAPGVLLMLQQGLSFYVQII